ncbi:MAG: acetate--CoA ligase family protein [Lewinellaceae bacterium]|nr:acetate--CoA ligase family protein [Lewinellaceae bacterium]
MAVRYRENLNLLHETPSDLPVELDNINRTGARVIVDIVQKSGRLHFEEAEAKRLLACYGIPINTSYLAKTEDEAAAIARNMGCAVALKIESPDIWYKSEVHGVRLGIERIRHPAGVPFFDGKCEKEASGRPHQRGDY